MCYRPFLRLAGVPALLALSLLVLLIAAGESRAATDNHPYPRTFHLFSCSGIDRYDLVVAYAFCNIKAARAANPGAIFLFEPGMSAAPTTSGTNYRQTSLTYGGQSTWAGGTDNLVDGAAANLGYIRPFDEEWDLLRRTDGSVAPIGGAYSHHGFNLADPTNKGTPTQIAKLIAYAAKRGKLYANGWDGVFSDNWDHSAALCQPWFYGSQIDTDRNRVSDCSGDTSTLRKRWDNGIVAAGLMLRSWLPGKIVGGNGNYFGNPTGYRGDIPDGWLRSANFTMLEHSERFWRNPDAWITTAKRWLQYPDPYGRPRYFATLQTAMDCNGKPFNLPSGADPNSPKLSLDPCHLRSMRWGLTLSVMTGTYYEIYPYLNHRAVWFYDEYDGGELHKRGYLGQPLNDPQKLQSGVYRRDFQGGVALNNSTDNAHHVALGARYKHIVGKQNPTLNNGSVVSSVTVPAHDGLILLRLGNTPPATPPATAATPPATPASQGNGKPSPQGGRGAPWVVRTLTPTNRSHLRGKVRWEATVNRTSILRVEFWIDGRLRWTERANPYVFNGDGGMWNTAAERPGRHTLTLRAVDTGGETFASTISVALGRKGATAPKIKRIKAKVLKKKVRVVVSVRRCTNCKARLDVRLRRSSRNLSMRRVRGGFVAAFRMAKSGGWRYRVIVVDEKSKLRVASIWRRVRVG